MNAQETFAVSQIEGNKVLTKVASRRGRALGGPSTSTNRTMEADVRFASGRTLGDGGVTAQGYELVLSGGRQRIELQSWQSETNRTQTAPLQLRADTWYKVRLRVELLLDGGTLARGEAWLAGESEPSTWTVERRDPPGLGQLIGSPGLYGDAPSKVHFDNIKIGPNR